jgi:hypothetical protein
MAGSALGPRPSCACGPVFLCVCWALSRPYVCAQRVVCLCLCLYVRVLRAGACSCCCVVCGGLSLLGHVCMYVCGGGGGGGCGTGVCARVHHLPGAAGGGQQRPAPPSPFLAARPVHQRCKWRRRRRQRRRQQRQGWWRGRRRRGRTHHAARVGQPPAARRPLGQHRGYQGVVRIPRRRGQSAVRPAGVPVPGGRSRCHGTRWSRRPRSARRPRSHSRSGCKARRGLHGRQAADGWRQGLEWRRRRWALRWRCHQAGAAGG